jgi:hypothetical protein
MDKKTFNETGLELAISAFYLLTCIKITSSPFFSSFHRLTVKNNGTGFLVSALLHPDLDIVDFLPGFIFFWLPKAGVHVLPFQKVLWQNPPQTTRSQKIKYGFGYFAEFNTPLTTPRLDWW